MLKKKSLLKLFELTISVTLIVGSFAHAARFGAMKVLSQTGEPLQAKIEILDVPQDQQGWLTLKSASQNAYENAALRFTSATQEMRTRIERDGKNIVAWLTTSTPIKEEFIDLLLTLNWSTGQMTEAFTVLIPHSSTNVDKEAFMPPTLIQDQASLPLKLTANDTFESKTLNPSINNSSSSNTDGVSSIPNAPNDADITNIVTTNSENTHISPQATEVIGNLNSSSSSVVPAAPISEDPVVTADIASDAAPEIASNVITNSSTEDTATTATTQDAISAASQGAIEIYPPPENNKKNKISEEITVKSKKELATQDIQNKPNAYKVHYGDTLSKLANEIKEFYGPEVNFNQLLLGVYQDNLEAFIDKNMNRLKTGVVLQIPSAQKIENIDKTFANQQVLIQAGEFERYRENIAALARSSQDSNNLHISTGKISANANKLIQPVGDQLKLSRSDNAAQIKSEKIVEEQLALNEAKDRVEQLEKHVQNLHKLDNLTESESKISPPLPIKNTETKHSLDVLNVKNDNLSIWQIKRIFRKYISKNMIISVGLFLIILLVLVIWRQLRSSIKSATESKDVFVENDKNHKIVTDNIPMSAKKIFANLSLDLDSEKKSKIDIVNNNINDNKSKNNLKTIQKNIIDNLETRLELAQAYWDLGDKNGAHQLLKEVIEQGNAKQKKQAQVLLDTFS